MAPLFLDLERILQIHRSMIERYGGEEGIRDAGILHSAVAMPQASYGGQYLHADLFEMAAAYLYHIVQNHAFLDGNKRTGAAAAVVFLAMNGINVRAEEEGLVDITLRVASGQVGKQEAAAFRARFGNGKIILPPQPASGPSSRTPLHERTPPIAAGSRRSRAGQSP